ncbi:MAG: thiamine-phosphate kinase [Chloroflexi bacterium]|nr:thiamine-phosphate kinase [Chloroflexota bacterium]
MKLIDLGEFGLIARLREAIEESRNPELESWQRLLIGTGDDCAAWRGDPRVQIATTDTLVQGVHFLEGTFTWEELGHKSMAANLSDIAAMGGAALYALVSFSLRADTDVADVLSLFRGMIEEGTRYGVAIEGGNLTTAPILVITIALLGNAGNGMLLRSAARPGDSVAVTGYLGASGAAVAVFKQELDVDHTTKELLRQSHFRPTPRIAEGQEMVRLGVKAAVDISDGLISDLTRICEASQVGARIDAALVPINPALHESVGAKSLEYALAGGEDFELLFTAPAVVVQRVRAALGIPVTVIGEIVAEHPGKVIVRGSTGGIPGTTGWDHFQK